MDIYEKYKLDKKEDVIVRKLPNVIEKSFYEIQKENIPDELYINENGTLKHVATKPYSFSILLLFLKKYRPHPELLPKNLKHESPKYRTSKTIYKAMQIMLIPMNSYEEFIAVLKKADKELMPMSLKDAWGEDTPEYYENLKICKYGIDYIFIKNRDEIRVKKTNVYGEELPVPNCRHYYIYNNKENSSYEIYAYNFEQRDVENFDTYFLYSVYYEEKYLYEYLLNEAIGAVQS